MNFHTFFRWRKWCQTTYHRFVTLIPLIPDRRLLEIVIQRLRLFALCFSLCSPVLHDHLFFASSPEKILHQNRASIGQTSCWSHLFPSAAGKRAQLRRMVARSRNRIRNSITLRVRESLCENTSVLFGWFQIFASFGIMLKNMLKQSFTG